MEVSFTKLWLSAGAVLIGAIAGAYIAMHRAAAAINAAGAKPDGDDTDALIHSSRSLFGGSAGAGISGAFWGAVVGLLIATAIFYFFNDDKIRLEKKMETGD